MTHTNATTYPAPLKNCRWKIWNILKSIITFWIEQMTNDKNETKMKIIGGYTMEKETKFLGNKIRLFMEVSV